MDNKREPAMKKSGFPGHDANKSTNTVSVMTEQMVVQHIKECRDITREFIGRFFGSFWSQWMRQIQDNATHARSNKEQTSLFETYNLMQAVADAAEQEFLQHISNGFVKFKNKTLNTLTGEERFSGDILSLVEHSDLEETIAITSITHRADNMFSEPLWALRQRLALLNDGEKIEDAGNPVASVQFCEALRKVLSNLEVDVKTKIIGYKFFDQDLVSQLDGLYGQMNDYLSRQNLLPNLRFNPSQPVNSKTGSQYQSGLDEDAAQQPSEMDLHEQQQRRNTERLLEGQLSNADVQYQNSLLGAIKLLQTHVALQFPTMLAAQQIAQVGTINPQAFTALPPMSPANMEVYSTPQLVNVFEVMQSKVLQQNQASLQSESMMGTQVDVKTVAEMNRQVMEKIVDENANGALEADDMQTIDLVGLLFEYMLSDEHLPDSVKTVLSYLHTPFLKIAFIDKDFFEQPEHPARVLLNSLAEAGARWVGNDGTDQYDIFAKIKTTVFHLLQEFKNDVRIFAETLIEFNSYTRNVARRQELMERRALEKAQGEERLREAKIQVNDEVRKRTDGKEMPSAILLLLLQPWSDYLSFVLLRYSDKSDAWQKALKVIDDLIWTLEPKTLQVEKARQMHIQEDLIAALEKGFETIGYEQAKGRKLLDAVSSLQRLALLSRKAEPAPAPMRSRLETMATEKAGGKSFERQVITPDEQRFMDSLKMVEFGTWFEFEGGKRLKVAWYNKKTQHYMLVDQQGRKVSLTSSLELARQMLSGTAKIISGSTKPFFERALENIYNTLNERADVGKVHPVKIEKVV
jgi:hypothetical protein